MVLDLGKYDIVNYLNHICLSNMVSSWIKNICNDSLPYLSVFKNFRLPELNVTVETLPVYLHSQLNAHHTF